MPKMKTNRAASKRFTRTGSGKFRRRRSFLRHILTSKNRKRKRGLGKGAIVHPSDVREIERLLPYG